MVYIRKTHEAEPCAIFPLMLLVSVGGILAQLSLRCCLILTIFIRQPPWIGFGFLLFLCGDAMFCVGE